MHVVDVFESLSKLGGCPPDDDLKNHKYTSPLSPKKVYLKVILKICLYNDNYVLIILLNETSFRNKKRHPCY